MKIKVINRAQILFWLKDRYPKVCKKMWLSEWLYVWLRDEREIGCNNLYIYVKSGGTGFHSHIRSKSYTRIKY
jgi:hypothetical protein